jgi:hypothetical protein
VSSIRISAQTAAIFPAATTHDAASMLCPSPSAITTPYAVTMRPACAAARRAE